MSHVKHSNIQGTYIGGEYIYGLLSGKGLMGVSSTHKIFLTETEKWFKYKRDDGWSLLALEQVLFSGRAGTEWSASLCDSFEL